VALFEVPPDTYEYIKNVHITIAQKKYTNLSPIGTESNKLLLGVVLGELFIIGLSIGVLNGCIII
jgi:hypothetical protein